VLQDTLWRGFAATGYALVLARRQRRIAGEAPASDHRGPDRRHETGHGSACAAGEFAVASAAMSLHDATVPIFTKLLSNIDKWLDKAAALADAKKFDVNTLATARLAPDQYPFVRQIQAACDQAKFTAAKLTGKEAPSHPDTEKTIAEIRDRIHTVVAYLATFKREDFNGAEERPCSHTWMGGKTLRGVDYLNHFALPNFYFHLTTAYDILRHNGVDVGKMDYIVDLPFRA